MLERLIDLVLNFLRLFMFWVVVDEFESAIVLTLGKARENRFLGLFGTYELGPGIHLVWPFNIDRILRANVVPTTSNLSIQSLTTLDNVSITISAVVTWKIRNVQKMLLKVENPTEALDDSTYGVLAECVQTRTWENIQSPRFSEIVTKAVRRKASRWGIHVEDVSLADKTKSLPIRLLNE